MVIDSQAKKLSRLGKLRLIKTFCISFKNTDYEID